MFYRYCLLNYNEIVESLLTTVEAMLALPYLDLAEMNNKRAKIAPMISNLSNKCDTFSVEEKWCNVKQGEKKHRKNLKSLNFMFFLSTFY